jgi:hypothetical protein
MYDWWEGTSFAAPHVAGLSAMLLQLHPTWTPGAVRKALESTAAAVTGAARPNNNEGWGLVQGNAANGFNPAPFPPSILPTATDFQDSATGAGITLRILVKPNGGVDSVIASLAAFGVAGTLTLSDSGTIAGGWHVYKANYTIPPGTASGMRHIRVMAYRNGAGAHDTVRAYINLYHPPIPVSVEAGDRKLPHEFALHQNFPNPFNPTTQIRFDVPEHTHVRLTVYDMLGREVKNLVNDVKEPGFHVVSFDGRALASGVYFYRINAGTFSATRVMVLVK